jgi:hypothetical protein
MRVRAAAAAIRITSSFERGRMITSATCSIASRFMTGLKFAVMSRLLRRTTSGSVNEGTSPSAARKDAVSFKSRLRGRPNRRVASGRKDRAHQLRSGPTEADRADAQSCSLKSKPVLDAEALERLLANGKALDEEAVCALTLESAPGG